MDMIELRRLRDELSYHMGRFEMAPVRSEFPLAGALLDVLQIQQKLIDGLVDEVERARYIDEQEMK